MKIIHEITKMKFVNNFKAAILTMFTDIKKNIIINEWARNQSMERNKNSKTEKYLKFKKKITGQTEQIGDLKIKPSKNK